MKCFGQKIRNYHCKVVLLDEQELIQEIQSTSNGQELLDNVFKHLNIIETAYFGLRYIDNTDQTNWLDPGKKLIKQLEGTDPFTLYFGVKYYAADPCKLLEEITRYQFFLQIKQDILQGRLPVPFDLSAELGAYSVQSELGDYDPRRHCTGYISEFRFVVNQSPDLETRITELHKSFAGQVPAVAELNYLEKVKWLEMYGVDLHPVLGEDHVDYFLGLTPLGVIVLRNKNKVGNYFWPRISKLNQKGKYFMLRVRNKSNEEQTYGFETPSRAACKHLWKCATEHQTFSRLVQVAPNAGNKLSTLNTRFRDSGRSESSVRRRAQPQFVRTPSRRYTRRAVEGAHDASSENKQEEEEESIDQINGNNGVSKSVSVPQPVTTVSTIYRTPSMAQMTRSDSPRSVRSAPWPAPNVGKSFSHSGAPSPRSVRSAGVGASGSRERGRNRDYSKDRKRSGSAESNSSIDSRSHRKHRHSRSRKNSDNESEVSRSSGRSHHSKRRHKSSSKKDSGSESENCHRHRHRHRHRHSSSAKYELVDSEVQWKEAQKKQQAMGIQQAAVVSSSNLGKQANPINSTPLSRKSGYMNSGLETESEASYTNKRRHRKHRSKSPKERLPDELKRHIDFKLIESEGLPDDQLRHIPYVKVETNTLKSSKIRYNNSIKSNRSVTLRQTNPENSCPDVKSELPSSGDSPPPPYTPPVTKGNQNSQTTGSLSVVSVSQDGMKVNANFTKTKTSLSQSSFNGRSSLSNVTFPVPPPPSKVMASNMNKCGLPGFDEYATTVSSHGRQRNPIIGRFVGDEGIGDMQHPSPSESPDSQKVDSHHENSDSGLGTDHHEYYKSENFSSLGYTLPRSQSKVSSKESPNPSSKYWTNGTSNDSSQQNWFLDMRGSTNNGLSMLNVASERKTMTLDRRCRKIDPIHQFIPIQKLKQLEDKGSRREYPEILEKPKLKLKPSQAPTEINHEMSTEL